MVETITLGTPTGSARMPLRRQRGAARAAGRDQAAEVAPRLRRSARRRAPSRVTALPRSPLKTARLAVGMVARDLARMDRRGRRLARGREVDRDDAQAELLEALAQEEQLAALGVEGAGDIGGAAARSRRPGSRSTCAGGRRGRLGRRCRVTAHRAPTPRLASASRGRGGAARAMSRDRRRRAAGVPAVEAAHACAARRRRATARRRRARARTVNTCVGAALGAAAGAGARPRPRRRRSSAGRAAAPAARGRRRARPPTSRARCGR